MKGRLSPRSIGPIARIAKTRNDEGVVVEVIVNGCGPVGYVRMDATQAFESGRYRNQANVPDVAGTALLEPIHRRNRRIRGRDDRSDNDDHPLGHIDRGLEKIFDRYQRIRITIKPYMGDARGRD